METAEFSFLTSNSGEFNTEISAVRNEICIQVRHAMEFVISESVILVKEEVQIGFLKSAFYARRVHFACHYCVFIPPQKDKKCHLKKAVSPAI